MTAAPSALTIEPSDHAGLSEDPLAMGMAFALVLTVVQRGVGFLRGMLFCRLMPDYELGQWSIIWSLLLLLAPMASLGLPGSFCRYSEHFRQRGQLLPYIRRVALISGVVTLLLAIWMVVAPRFFSWIIFRESDQVELVRVIAACFVLVALFNAVQSLIESLRQIRIVTMMRFVSGMVFAVAGFLFLSCWRNGTMAVVAGFGVGCIAGLIPASLFFIRASTHIRQSNRPLPHAAMWAKIAPFAAWTWLSNILNNSYESIDRFMLLHLSDHPELAQSSLGQYHSSLIIPQLLMSLAVVISGTLFPYLATHWENGRFGEARRTLRWSLKLTAFTFTTLEILILCLAPLLYDSILQGRFSEGQAILPMTLIYCFWFSIVACAQDALWCGEKLKWVAIVLVIGLASNALFNGICIPLWGLRGAVIATALGNAICLAALFTVNHWHGWSVDRGTIVACLCPLFLLLGATAAVACWLLVAVGVVRFQWIFDDAEKLELRRLSRAAWQRIRPTAAR